MDLMFETQVFIGVWPGDDKAELRGFGDSIMCPPRDVVAVVGGQSPYRFPSATFADGTPIPGTIALRNAYTQDPEGQQITTFDAMAFLRIIKANQKELLARGFTVVSQPEDVAAAKAAGRPLWEKAMIASWQAAVREELDRQSYWEKKNQPCPPSSSEESVRVAIAGLRAAKARMATASITKTDLLVALGAQDAPAAAPAPPAIPAVDLLAALEGKAGGAPAPPAAEPEGPNPDDLAAVADALFEAAEANGVDLTKKQLQGILRRDADVIEEVRAKVEAATRAA